MPGTTFESRDHDLLVRLDTKLDTLTTSFAEIRSTVASKASSEWVERIDNRLAGVEKKMYMFAGVLFALQLVLQWFLGNKK